MKLLIIDDDKDLISFLKKNFKKEGFSVSCCENGAQGSEMISKRNHDIAIIDLNLPDMSGLEICEQARKEKIMTPFLILSGEEEIDIKTRLLNAGADDYLTKPFSFEELLARVNALLRRPPQLSEEIIKIGDMEINLQTQQVKIKGEEIYLTRREYLILELLAYHPGKVFSRADILENAWDEEADIFSRAIETHILNLRKKIDRPHKSELIKTVTGRGYKIG